MMDLSLRVAVIVEIVRDGLPVNVRVQTHDGQTTFSMYNAQGQPVDAVAVNLLKVEPAVPVYRERIEDMQAHYLLEFRPDDSDESIREKIVCTAMELAA